MSDGRLGRAPALPPEPIGRYRVVERIGTRRHGRGLRGGRRAARIGEVAVS